MGINVRLKPKAKKDNSQRIFLDIWHVGRRWNEPTSLRISPDMTDREVEVVMAQAEAIASARWVQVLTEQKASADGDLSRVFFADYYILVADTRSDSTKDAWYGAFPTIQKYSKKTRLRDIDAKWLRGLKSFLAECFSEHTGRRLSQNTQSNYFARVRATLTQAHRDEIIVDNPAARVTAVPQVYGPRTYLTLEEIGRLNQTPMPKREQKIACMFNLYMGLRIKDLRNLKWGSVEKRGDEYYLVWDAEKDDDKKFVPIPPPALEWLPERGNSPDDARVFQLYCGDQFNRNLREWARAAGISKDITSHALRHTMAVQALDAGLDISDIQAKLGQSTQRMAEHYAKISPSKMMNASKRFPCLTPTSR